MYDAATPLSLSLCRHIIVQIFSVNRVTLYGIECSFCYRCVEIYKQKKKTLYLHLCWASASTHGRKQSGSLQYTLTNWTYPSRFHMFALVWSEKLVFFNEFFLRDFEEEKDRRSSSPIVMCWYEHYVVWTDRELGLRFQKIHSFNFNETEFSTTK